MGNLAALLNRALALGDETPKPEVEKNGTRKQVNRSSGAAVLALDQPGATAGHVRVCESLGEDLLARPLPPSKSHPQQASSLSGVHAGDLSVVNLETCGRR